MPFQRPILLALLLVLPGCLDGPDSAPVSSEAIATPCANSWATGNYTFADPPGADAHACTHRALDNVTLDWMVFPEDIHWSHPLAAGVGYDWLFMAEYSTEVQLIVNETGEITTLGDAPGADTARSVSAVRLENGEIHLLYEARTMIQAVREIVVHRWVIHWWVTPGQVPEVELLPGARGPAPDYAPLRTDGHRIIGLTGEVGASYIHWTTGGAMTTDIIPHMIVWGVALDSERGYACAGGPVGFILLEREWGEGDQLWRPDQVPGIAGFFGMTGHCRVTPATDGPVLTHGGGDTTAVWQRRSDGWHHTTIQAGHWSDRWLSTVRGVPVFYSDGGGGSQNGGGVNAWFWSPTTPNATGPWAVTLETWSDEVVLLDTTDRIAAISTSWGDPFRFPFLGPDGNAVDGKHLARLGTAVAMWDLHPGATNRTVGP